MSRPPSRFAGWTSIAFVLALVLAVPTCRAIRTVSSHERARRACEEVDGGVYVSRGIGGSDVCERDGVAIWADGRRPGGMP